MRGGQEAFDYATKLNVFFFQYCHLHLENSILLTEFIGDPVCFSYHRRYVRVLILWNSSLHMMRVATMRVN